MVTSPATAPRLVDTVVAAVISAASKEDTAVVDMEVVVAAVDKPATLAVVMDTCLVGHLSIRCPTALLTPPR